MGKKERQTYENEIINLFTIEKLNLTNISYKLQINRLDVKKVLIHKHLYSEDRKYLEKENLDHQYIIDLYTKDNKSLKSISQETGYDIKAISKLLKSKNIELKSAKYYNRKYKSKDDAFKFYTPESVYWGGFIAGDGCVYSHGLRDSTINNCLNVGLASVDREHVLKLKDYLKYEGPLYESINKASLNVNNLKIVEDLFTNFNITNNKTDTYKPPNSIPEYLVKYFVLGLIDSDGTICKTKRPKSVRGVHKKGEYIFQLGVTGTNEVCCFVNNFFDNDVKLFSRRQESENNYSVIYQGNLQILKYLNNLYDEESIKFCLKRKYEKYVELVEQYK